VNIKIRPLAATGGWIAAIRSRGYKVLSRAGDFGVHHHVLKRGKASTTFAQAPTRILFANVNDGQTLADMEQVGLIAS